MPEYTHLDRCMIEAETTVWIAHETLCQIECSGAFMERLGAVKDALHKIAVEMREYNDQFEE